MAQPRTPRVRRYLLDDLSHEGKEALDVSQMLGVARDAPSLGDAIRSVAFLERLNVTLSLLHSFLISKLLLCYEL